MIEYYDDSETSEERARYEEYKLEEIAVRNKFMKDFDNASKKLGLKYRTTLHFGRFIHIYGGLNPFFINPFAIMISVFGGNSDRLPRAWIDLTEKQERKLLPIINKLTKYRFIITRK